MTAARARPLIVVAACVATVLLSGALSTYHLFLGTLAASSGLVALSIGIGFGYAGISSLCQWSFALVGAYVMAELIIDHDVNFFVALAIGAVAAAPAGMLLGLIALRMRSVDLMVATLALAVAFRQVVGNIGFPGESEGAFIPRPDVIGSDRAFFLFAWGCFAVIAAMAYALSHSRLGHSWLAIKRSERASAAMGLRPLRVRVAAFAFGAFAAGAGGTLLLGAQGVVAQASFAPIASLAIFLAAVMSGAQYVEGAILAGVLGVVFPEVLSALDVPADFNTILFAVGAIQVLAKGGEGIAGDLRGALRRLTSRGARRADEAVDDAATDRSAAAIPGPVSIPVPAGGRALPDSALRVEHVTMRFGAVTALADVSFSVHTGEISALIGPNGAGKSTAVDVITGFLTPTEGHVLVDAERITTWSPQRRTDAGIRRTFQHERTIPELTVGQFLDLSMGRRADRAVAGEIAATLGLPPRQTVVGTLDVGARRMLEVAACAVAGPRFLLLDEPAAGLGEEQVESLLQTVRALPALVGTGVILIEHDMRVVRSVAQRVVVLNFGEVIADGPTEDVLNDPDVLDAYLGDSV